MRELDAILETWRCLEGKDRDAVLATVVHVTGSSYRRPGARMLIVPGGRRVGCVSGGCLEGEIVRKAWWFTESDAPAVRIYDTTSDDDAIWEFGLGCNGVVHVLLERVNAPAASAMLDFIDAQRAAQKSAVVATVIRTESRSGIRVGDRLLLDESSTPVGMLLGSEIECQVMLHAAEASREKKSRLAHIGTTCVFVEWIGTGVVARRLWRGPRFNSIGELREAAGLGGRRRGQPSGLRAARTLPRRQPSRTTCRRRSSAGHRHRY